MIGRISNRFRLAWRKMGKSRICMAETARRVGNTPVWIFHGDADDSVPVDESRKMYAALQEAGAKTKYSEYPGVGHNSWDKAYAEPELVPWLLNQRLLR